MPARRSAAGCPSFAASSTPRASTSRSGARCPKSRAAPAQVRRALDEGAELVFVWGGDGMVQRCVDVLAGSEASLAIVPAGTANLFASNLGIPKDIGEAVEIGLHGERRKLDVGRFNGERFAVMAGAGFDAAMIRDAGNGGLKERFGRAAYVWSGAENLRVEAVPRRDRGRRGRLVQGQGELHPARQRRQALRRRRGVRGRAARRREARAGRRHGRGPRRVGPDDRARGRRHGEQVAVRADDEGALGQGQAGPEGPLRARRRRSHQGEVVQGQGRAGAVSVCVPAPTSHVRD